MFRRTSRFPLALAVATLATPVLVAPADAAATATLATYRTCAHLHRDHPSGVGKPGAVDKDGGRVKANPVRTFRVDARLYASLPTSLDRDRDGIACEKHAGPARTPATPRRLAARPSAARRVITTAEATPGFVTPSGNIMCSMGDMRCDITKRTYRAPKKPSWCEVDWGNSFELNRTARLGCVGDSVWGAATITRTENRWSTKTGAKPLRTAAGPQAVLPYGWTLRKGAFACTSATTGVTCTNLNTRHGFRVSTGSYRLF